MFHEFPCESGHDESIRRVPVRSRIYQRQVRLPFPRQPQSFESLRNVMLHNRRLNWLPRIDRTDSENGIVRHIRDI